MTRSTVRIAGDLIPWEVTDISLRPYKHFFSFNPSLKRDGDRWLCVLRCADYHMTADGETIRSKKATPGEVRTKNAMVVLDPSTWRPLEIYKIKERDDYPRARSSSIGYEDVRLFRTQRGGLQGIAASQHLRRDRSARKSLAEQVLITFDENFDVVSALPIRGSWSSAHQKNWVPFDGAAEPRFLYSIDEGTLLGDRGALSGEEARVLPSGGQVVVEGTLHDGSSGRARASERAGEALHERSRRSEEASRRQRLDLSDLATGTATLRGGTQLVRVGDDAWLGVGHAMKRVGRLKCYHHVWYVVDDHGSLRSKSPAVKFAPDNPIEFAAGLAIDGDRVVVSFGVDDAECKIAETRLPAVMGLLR